ncbi:MAG: hypothetical protein MI741_23315 [Rhodospirillales bacterium]|nr:hypothetical protein [Rhodospirillales bacterium]
MTPKGSAFEFDDQKLEELIDRYFKSLGQFIATFGLTEVHVTSLLIFYHKTPYNVAKANLSGVRIEQAISQIRRTIEAYETTLDPVIDDTLTHLSKINKVRNFLVHYGFEVQEDDVEAGLITINNNIVAHAERTRREFQISPEIIDAMSHDLTVAIVRIQGELYKHEMTNEDQFNRHFGEARSEPWHYTRHVLDFRNSRKSSG